MFYISNSMALSIDDLIWILATYSLLNPTISDNFWLCVRAVRVFAEAYSSCNDGDKDHVTGLIQLLDLMHTLHTRALSIFKPPNVEGQRVPINDSSMQPIVGEVG